MGLQCKEHFAVFVLCVIGCSCLVSSAANSTQEEEDINCSGEISLRHNTFSEEMTTSRRPNSGSPSIINLLHSPTIYGYLGDANVPGYQNHSSFDDRPSSDKWRLVCKQVSKIIVLILSMEMEEDGEYLQFRRKMLKGTNNKFQFFNLDKNSVLVSYVHPEPPREHYPFRLVYFCIRNTKFDMDHKISRIHIAEYMLASDDILTYLQKHQEGIEKLGQLFQEEDINYSLNNHKDSMTKTLIGLAYFGSNVIKDQCGRNNDTLRFT